MPFVTRKVSSCISCQCGGGPGVFGGIISSTAEMRLSVGHVIKAPGRRERGVVCGLAELGGNGQYAKFEGRRGENEIEKPTSSRSIFHNPQCNRPQLDNLSSLCMDEVDGYVGSGNDGRHCSVFFLSLS